MPGLVETIQPPLTDKDRYAFAHLPTHLHHAGNQSQLYRLIRSNRFREQQLASFGRPKMVTDGIDAAVDLAVQHRDYDQLVYFAMLRTNETTQWFRSDLFRLVPIARDHPQRAWEIAVLVPDPALCRIALVLLACVLRDDPAQRDLVERLIGQAADIATPATIGQTPALLEMTRELYCAGFIQASRWLRVIPASAPRRWYQAGWDIAPGALGELGAALRESEAWAGHSSDAEDQEFQRLNALVTSMEGRLGRGLSLDTFEERLFDAFGISGVSEALFLMATEKFKTGNFEVAFSVVNRGVYTGCAFTLPAIRTLAALSAVLAIQGERDLANEHLQRLQTLSKLMQRASRKEQDYARFQDALSDLRIATDVQASPWRPPGVDSLHIQTLASRKLPGRESQPDLLIQMANARQLLATGQNRPLQVLHSLLDTTMQSDPPSVPVLVSLYAMARACQDAELAAACAEPLNARGLQVETLFLDPGDPDEIAPVFQWMVSADPRCVACVALGLRLCGCQDRLLKFAQAASSAGAGIEILDAILSQVVCLPGLGPAVLQQIGENVVQTTARQIKTPSGLGMYYFPGILLWSACSGLVLVAAGIRAALFIPYLLVMGIIVALVGLAGSFIDLFIWKKIGLWEKPERSRNLFSELGTLTVPWLALYLMRSWTEDMQHTPLGGVAIAGLILSLVPGLIAGKNGYLFTSLSRRAVLLTVSAAVLLAALLVGFLPALFGDAVTSAIAGGLYLAGMLEIGFSMNIIPKRVAVLRYYRDKEQQAENENI